MAGPSSTFRRSPAIIKGLEGMLSHRQKAKETAGLVHILGQSPLPDAVPGSETSDRSFIGSWNGVPSSGILSYVLRWGHGGMGDGASHTSMEWPGHNSQFNNTGYPYLCVYCILADGTMKLLETLPQR